MKRRNFGTTKGAESRINLDPNLLYLINKELAQAIGQSTCVLILMSRTA